MSEPHEVSLNEATRILGQVFDKPDLKYVQISLEEERDKLIKAGLHPSVADSLIEMDKAFDTGLIKPTQELTAEHRGTTTFDEFANMLVHDFWLWQEANENSKYWVLREK